MTSTTETLQLEHLCGYLPYGLKVIYNSDGSERELLFLDTSRDDYKHIFKPLLIPLSELTRELLNNEMPEQLIRICKTNQKHILTYGYQTICILMKYHFDVFGLLEKGLAVSELPHP